MLLKDHYNTRNFLNNKLKEINNTSFHILILFNIKLTTRIENKICKKFGGQFIYLYIIYFYI